MTKVWGSSALIGAGMAVCILPASAFAQAQSSDQQKCINSLYKSGAKVIAAVAKDYSTCVGSAVDEDLGSQTAQECLTADNSLAVNKAKIGLSTASTKCTAVPTIGPSDAEVAAEGFTRDPMRANDLFGDNLDDAIVPSSIDAAIAGCQEGVVASLGKLMKAKTKEFDKCVSAGMREATIDSPSDVSTCVGADLSGKVQRAVDKTQLSIGKFCSGVNVAEAFPGDCAGSPLGSLAECTANLLDCGICLTTLAAGGVIGDCDALDDGLNNNSCGPVWPDTSAEYVAGPTSYIHEVGIPPVDEDTGAPTCCRDFGPISKDFIENGTDHMDNALAVLADNLGSLVGFDLEGLLNDAIQTGSFSLLVDHPGLDTGGPLPAELALATFSGEWTNGTDYATAAAGNGDFLIDSGAFVPGTGEPVSVFYPSTFNVGDEGLQAGPATLQFPIPFGFVLLELPIASVNISADATLVSGGIQYDDGKVSGYLLVDSFFGALNQLLDSPLCDCLNLSQSIYYKNESGVWTGAGRCVNDPETLCTEEAESLCVTLSGSDLFGGSPQVCSVLPSVIASTADIDLNNDPEVYEGFSAGFTFGAVPANVVGVTP